MLELKLSGTFTKQNNDYSINAKVEKRKERMGNKVILIFTFIYVLKSEPLILFQTFLSNWMNSYILYTYNVLNAIKTGGLINIF